MKSKIVNIKIESHKYSRIGFFCRNFEFLTDFPDFVEPLENISRMIKFLLICGYIRWKTERKSYVSLIKEYKYDMLRNLENNFQKENEVCSVKIPVSFLDKLDMMRKDLESEMKNCKVRTTDILSPYLINVRQNGIKKNIQKLSRVELLKIITEIELTMLNITWRNLKRENFRKNLTVTFPMNAYIQLCENLDEYGFMGNNFRYLAMIDVFANKK